jgi:hypothetical protein
MAWCDSWPMTPNALVNRRRSPEGAQGTDSGHKNAEGMPAGGVRVERRG